MKKETFADKLARKSFESTAVQKSWQLHMQAFGAILEPAFVDNYQARINLTAALNSISNHDLEKGFKKLQLMEKSCSTDEDRAAWFFCMGLCFEMANMKKEMIVCYQEAGKRGHSFYLPYLKIAKTAQNDTAFEIAEENYRKAIQCLSEDEPNEQRTIITASAYTNYASCLTMMHRYEEAEEALKKSMEILPEQNGRAATQAILAAAKGEAEKAHHFADIFAEQSPASSEMTMEMVDRILEKKHPQFNIIAVQKASIETFWNWFVSNEGALLKILERKEYDTAFQMLQPKLKELFPFMERDPEFQIEPGEEFCQITFADCFMVSLEQGYKDIIAAAPEALMKHWRFDTTR